MTSSKNAPPPPSADGLSLGEFLGVLWGGRWIILGCVAAALLLAGFYVWRATPIYQVDALLQIEAKQSNQNRPALEGRIEGLFQVSSQAQAEMEILQSNQVLARVVQALHLDLVAAPKTSRFFGAALLRGAKEPPQIEVEIFELPEKARGQEFLIEATGNGGFTWMSHDGAEIGQGRVGEFLQAAWRGLPLQLKVRRLVGNPGQRYGLERLHLLDAIDNLRKDLGVSEKGKESNILALTFQHTQPDRGAEILNALLDQYSRENIERLTAEATRTLSFLQEQMGTVREKLGKSEQMLDQSRAGSRAADLGEVARQVLQRSVDIEKETLALRQKREELLRTYQEQSDVVTTLDQQIAKLQEEGRRLDAQGRSLPRAQQEVLRLTRDVQVNQEHFNFLRNLEVINSQQLQMAKAGDIQSSRILDRAMPSLVPVKPKKSMVLGLSLVLGALAGIGFVLLRRTLHPGVEDPQTLEAQFGLPVLATIPHSRNQADIVRQSRKTGEQHALLSADHPDDLAVESFRSLRTYLQFTLVDAPNRAIMIAGSSPEIGKSFVSTNFAVILAQHGARVLLLDADLRKGKLHRHFGALARKNGLSEILAGTLPWREALHHAHGLDMISTGTLPPNPSELLHGKRFAAFMAEACAAYDFVIIDVPPVLAVTDAAIVGAHAGAVLLVVKDGQHTLAELRATLQCLDMAGIRPKGFIFNDMTPRSAPFGYPRYAYHYSYKI
jgi:tyrosine-protein kinase Etk/Wzc